MKIGFVCSEYPTLPVAYGGIGTATQTIARGLCERGHKAIIYAATKCVDVSDDGPVQIVAIPRNGVIRTLQSVRQRIRNDIDAGHIDAVEAPECESHFLPNRSGALVRLHGSHHFWCTTLRQRRKPIRLWLEQVGIRRARGICAVSKFAADCTREAMNLKSREIDVIYNPVDINFFRPAPDTRKPWRIVFVGSVVEKKGILELCLAMEEIMPVFPNVELVVIGRDCKAPDGSHSYHLHIFNTVNDMVKCRTRFLGQMPSESVRDCMAAAELCVFPSYMETQGLVICEAMACGRPVVASKTGPGPEIVGKDGECGRTVVPTDPEDIARVIRELLSNRSTLEEMGCRGRKRVEALFSLDSCMDKNLAFYTKYASERSNVTV